MSETELDLFRSVRAEQFPDGTVIEGKPAPEVLYPDFAPRRLPNGKVRDADVKYTGDDKQWVRTGGGTSLFDRANVFRGQGWLGFTIPRGTVIPDSLQVQFTGYNVVLKAKHYQIECMAKMMRLDAFKGALDNLARNAVVRSIELASGVAERKGGVNG